MDNQTNDPIIWLNGEYRKACDANVSILSHSLHYGSAVFEGTRVYKSDTGSAIFRLDDHINRLLYSANIMGMTLPYEPQHIRDITLDLVCKNGYDCCYLRHLCYYGSGDLRIMPSQDTCVEMAVACWPWETYLSSTPIDMKTSHYIRIHPRSTVANAKIAGHYVNSILSGLALRGTHYKEALLLDSNGFVAEAGSANFFAVKDNKIYTPLLGTILDGITRNTVIQLARQLGYEVLESNLKVEDVYAADEAFLTGTAAEITYIATLDDKLIGQQGLHPVATRLREAYMDAVKGKNPDFEHYLTYV